MLRQNDHDQVMQPLLSLAQPFFLRPPPNLIQILSLDKSFPQLFNLLCGQALKHGMNSIRADLKTTRN